MTEYIAPEDRTPKNDFNKAVAAGVQYLLERNKPIVIEYLFSAWSRIKEGSIWTEPNATAYRHYMDSLMRDGNRLPNFSDTAIECALTDLIREHGWIRTFPDGDPPFDQKGWKTCIYAPPARQDTPAP